MPSLVTLLLFVFELSSKNHRGAKMTPPPPPGRRLSNVPWSYRSDAGDSMMDISFLKFCPTRRLRGDDVSRKLRRRRKSEVCSGIRSYPPQWAYLSTAFSFVLAACSFASVTLAAFTFALTLAAFTFALTVTLVAVTFTLTLAAFTFALTVTLVAWTFTPTLAAFTFALTVTLVA